MYSDVAKFLQKDLEGFFKYGMHLLLSPSFLPPPPIPSTFLIAFAIL